MCAECRQYPCHPMCPNAPEPPVVHTCTRCGEGIFVGDEYAEIDGEYYCEPCIEDMPYCELVTLLGGDWRTASEDEIDDGSDEAYERARDERMFDD